MNRSIRIPLLSLGAALVVVVIGACGASLAQFGETCSVYAVDNPCESPNICECQVGSTCACTKRCAVDKDCPTGTACLVGQNPASNNEANLYCFKPDAGP